MEVTKVLITDMPGPAWWEFVFQWGGLMIQAAVAAATVAAVVLALNVAKRDKAWRQDQERRQATIAWGIVENALFALDSAIGHLGQVYENLSSEIPITDNKQLISLLSILEAFETPSRVDSCWKISERLHVLSHDAGKELIFVMTNWPGLLGGFRPAIKEKLQGVPGRKEFLRELQIMQNRIVMSCNSIGFELRKFRGEPLMSHVPPFKSVAWQPNC